jgi:hypothetical protein
MSYKVEVNTVKFGSWDSNSVRFATKEEAVAYGNDLWSRWTAVRDHRVVESDDLVNYRWEGVLVSVKE